MQAAKISFLSIAVQTTKNYYNDNHYKNNNNLNYNINACKHFHCHNSACNYYNCENNIDYDYNNHHNNYN